MRRTRDFGFYRSKRTFHQDDFHQNDVNDVNHFLINTKMIDVIK